MEIINAFHRALHSCNGMGSWDKMVGKSKVCMGKQSQLLVLIEYICHFPFEKCD